MTAPVLDLRERRVYVLVGPAGAGKTRIAKAFPKDWRLSLDSCRRRVADDPGDQGATGDAVSVFDTVFAARLARRLSTVIDATNTERTVRVRLVALARRHRMPAVAVTVPEALAVCQARQKARTKNRQVPPGVVAAQHAGIPTEAQLRAEGFAAVHNAHDLDLLGMLLAQAAAAPRDLLADVRAAFGDDLADVFTFDPERPDSVGMFAVARRRMALRWSDRGGVYTHHWQARVDTQWCERCGGVMWAAVADAIDLAAVYRGELPDDLHCDRCDSPARQTACPSAAPLPRRRTAPPNPPEQTRSELL